MVDNAFHCSTKSASIRTHVCISMYHGNIKTTQHRNERHKIQKQRDNRKHETQRHDVKQTTNIQINTIHI